MRRRSPGNGEEPAKPQHHCPTLLLLNIPCKGTIAFQAKTWYAYNKSSPESQQIDGCLVVSIEQNTGDTALAIP